MKRHEFVVVFKDRNSTSSTKRQCVLCKRIKDITLPNRALFCYGFECSNNCFDNTKHIPIITTKQCFINDCGNKPENGCNRCIFNVAFNLIHP